MKFPDWTIAVAMALGGSAAWADTPRGPIIPEPMVFDMMRPLTAARGELEVNTLATTPLSGPGRAVHWAPEAEYAFADGHAVEFELPFEDARLAELKIGLQGRLGTFAGDRAVHGWQYLGIYDRQAKDMRHALLYMAGHRLGRRWSMMHMIGVGDVQTGRADRQAGLLVNHSTFYDVRPGSVAGLEINFKGGREGGVLLMPQWHQRVGGFSVQAGLGVERDRGTRAAPTGGVRLIREL